MNASDRPNGTGIGLRGPHVPQILAQRPPVPWFEVLADNYLEGGGLMEQQLDQVAHHYPLTFHCVGMSLGSLDPLDQEYFRRLDRLIERHAPMAVSDHVSFSTLNGRHYHDLLPLPYTEEALELLVERVVQAQDLLGRQLLLENPSTYIRFNHSTLGEAEFLNALADRAGCGLLLDLNNLYVNGINHGESTREFLAGLETRHVQQIHLGGHEQRDGYLLDSHSREIAEPVWALYADYLTLHPDTPVLIEWDNELPTWETLLGQAERAESLRPKRHQASNL